jgi:hypothetical protein
MDTTLRSIKSTISFVMSFNISIFVRIMLLFTHFYIDRLNMHVLSIFFIFFKWLTLKHDTSAGMKMDVKNSITLFAMFPTNLLLNLQRLSTIRNFILFFSKRNLFYEKYFYYFRSREIYAHYIYIFSITS